MITQAYIMGSLGKATFQQDGKWYVIHADEPTLALPWHPFDHNLLSLNDPEILEVQAPQSVEQLSQLLQTETTKQEALTLALQLMDTSIERLDLKERIAVMLAEYVQEETVIQFLENRLLSTPAPASFQPGFASNLCRAMQQQRLAALYDLLDRHVDEMEAMRVAWIKIAKANFESSEQAYATFTFLVEEGHFAALTRALAAHDVKSWDNAISNASQALKAFGITNVAQLLSAIYSELIGHFALHSEEATTSHMLPNHVKNFLNDIESTTYDEVPNEGTESALTEWHIEVLSAKALKKAKEHKIYRAVNSGSIAYNHTRGLSGLENAIKRLEDSLRLDDQELTFQRKKATSSEGKLEGSIRGAKFKKIEERVIGKRVRLAELMKARNDMHRQSNSAHEKEAHIAAKKAERQQVKAKKSVIK